MEVSESTTFTPEIEVSAAIESIFHSFFHRCGKLWGETEQPWDCQAGAGR